MARTNWRSVGHDRLVRLMPDPANCLQTPSRDALGAALTYLLFDRAANVLVVNGGDGTIHHVLNECVRVVERARAATGLALPLPRFLFVNGGGMNMLARVFLSRGHPVRTLGRFMGSIRRSRVGSLRTRDVPLLAVREGEAGPVRLGYIFGSEIVLNALTLYERFGQGYRGLARFIAELAGGYVLNTAIWQQYGHLMDPPTTPLVVDGVAHDAYTAVVATTVPLQLAKGAISAVRRTAAPGEMNVVAVVTTDKAAIIRQLPQLMWGSSAAGVQRLHAVRELRLAGPYSLDGERFDRLEADEPLVVTGSQHVLRGIWLG
ncbi:MAG: hypothetical protein H6745_18130 [Deltaproteobacteria bacterium]|nr:hypothetical protein [Deltaproteobacteria bacterium]